MGLWLPAASTTEVLNKEDKSSQLVDGSQPLSTLEQA